MIKRTRKRIILTGLGITAGLALTLALAVFNSAFSSEPKKTPATEGSKNGPELLENSFKSGRLAFTYSVAGDEDIYVIRFDSQSITPIAPSAKKDEYPDWSPDGRKLAFYSDRTGDREIFVVDYDGSNLTQLTRSPGIDEDPNWSADGKQIVFHSERLESESFNLFMMNADGSNQTALTTQTNGDQNTVPKFSPRGSEIVYSTSAHWPGWDLVMFDLKTRESTLLTSGLRSFCRANWHPDGGGFAFSYGSGSEIDLYYFDKGEESPLRLTSLAGKEYDPVWLDDGSGLFFANQSSEPNSKFQIYFLDLITGNVQQITSGKGSARYLSYTSMPEVESAS